MTTGKRNERVLILAAVAMVALVVGHAQAEAINVPNGIFQMFKPGTDYAVAAVFGPGNNYSQGTGDNLAVIGLGLVYYSDGTSGSRIDCPGWVSRVGGSGNNDLYSAGALNDGTTCFNAFGTWSGGAGTLGQSSASLGDLAAGRIYTVSAIFEGSAGPMVLELLAGGVALTPSSSVTPTLPTTGWQEVSRTYNATDVAAFGQPMTILLGTRAIAPEVYVGTRGRWDNVTLEVENPMNPFPDYGDLIKPAGMVELSWTNWPSRVPDSNDVFVDVLFGTEPNELSPNYDMTLVVDATTPAGKNATSVEVDASEVGTYYWEVISYVNGPDKINDANALEWVTWTFTTINDLPVESVDAGKDMVTWSGQTVQLDATVEDDGESALTYLWTADPNEGVVFSDETAEGPTVTITKPLWYDVTVPNPSFEDRGTLGVLADGVDAYNQWAIEYWRHFEVDNNGGPLRIWNPGVVGVAMQGIADVGFGGNAPDGNYIVVVRSRYNDNEMPEIRPIRDWEAAVQLLDETFDPGASYKLTVQVGRMPEGPDNGGSVNYLWTDGGADPNNAGPVLGWHGYAVQLAAGGTNVGGATYAGRVDGGTVIAEDYNTLTVPMNTFVTSTVEYTPDTRLAHLAGLPLQIRLCALEDPADHSTTSWAAFDDVKLLATVTKYELKLAVHDEYNTTPLEDTLTISVYDDTCQAAVFGMSLDADNPSDFNKDCVASLQDLAVIAEKWVVDNSSTEPVAK